MPEDFDTQWTFHRNEYAGAHVKKQRLPPQPLQVAEWEQELNALVYELYKLTNEEIKIVVEGVK